MQVAFMRAERHVYRLRDPRDSRIKYVGCAINPQSRFKSHLSRSHNRHVRSWIAELRQCGLRPQLEVVGKAGDFFRAPDVESADIDFASRQHGAFVANIRRPVEQRRLTHARRMEHRRRMCANKAWHYVRTQAHRMLIGKLPSCDKPQRTGSQPYKPPRVIELNGEALNLAQWAKRCGVSRERIRQRLLKYPPAIAIGQYLTTE